MRIALLDWVCDPAQPGTSGLSDIVWELGGALRRQGDDAIVIGTYDRNARLPDAALPVFRFERPPAWHRNVLGQAMTCLALSRAVRQLPGVDAVFAPEYLSAAMLAVALPRTPVVFTTPGNIYERIAHGNPFDWPTTQVYKIAVRTASRRAARVIALSRHMRDWWIRTGTPPDRISVVPLGVNLDLHYPRAGARQRLGIPEDEETVLYAGRFSVEKNVAVLIRAVARLAPERPRLRLRLLGSGPEEAALRALARDLGVASAVEFTGWVPRASVPDFYSAADVVVLPSTSEPLARVLLEALACGAFVIASTSGGTPDVVRNEENGLLVEALDVDAWATAMRRAFDDPAWRMARARVGQDAVTRDLSWPAIASRLRDEVFTPAVAQAAARADHR